MYHCMYAMYKVHTLDICGDLLGHALGETPQWNVPKGDMW